MPQCLQSNSHTDAFILAESYRFGVCENICKWISPIRRSHRRYRVNVHSIVRMGMGSLCDSMRLMWKLITRLNRSNACTENYRHANVFLDLSSASIFIFYFIKLRADHWSVRLFFEIPHDIAPNVNHQFLSFILSLRESILRSINNKNRGCHIRNTRWKRHSNYQIVFRSCQYNF